MKTSETPARYWVGADIGKETFDAAVIHPGQSFPATPMRDVPAQTFARTPKGVEQFLAWLDRLLPGVPPDQVRMVMEATGAYSLELAAWLAPKRAALAPAIVNPHRASEFIKSLGLRNMTDRLAARALAFYGAERRPAPYEPPSPERAKLRELSRYRDFLVHERVAQENQASEGKPSKPVRAMQQRRLRQIERDVAKIEKEMQALIRNTPDLQRDYALLVTMPGVAFVTAAVILAEIGDLRRFQEARQLSAFAGLAPRIHDSGTSVHKKPHLSKCGNARIRQALYLAAMTAIRRPGVLRTTYENFIYRERDPLEKMAALCAIARKMLLIMRAMLVSETTFGNRRKLGGKLHPVCA